MTARDLATRRIAHHAKRFPDLDVRLSPDDGAAGLDARDAALAAAIEQATLRRWLTLVAVLQSQLSRPWNEIEHALQAALLSGASQLLLFDRLPDYAVIDEMVEWAKSNVRPKAGGMVNAVLRKVAGLRGEIVDRTGKGNPAVWSARDLPLHDGRVLELKADVFVADGLARLSQQTSHRLDLLEHWLGLAGRQIMLRLAGHSLVQPPIIVHGLSNPDAADIAQLTPHDEPGFFVFDAQGASSVADFMAQHRRAIVQDPAAAAPVQASAALVGEPSLIIDACAGKGTKTRQLVRLHPKAQVIATDIDRTRFNTLKSVFAHNSDGQRVSVIEYDRLMDYAGRADLVVLDVPCSNTGVLSRRVEAKYRFNRQALRKLVDLQRQIIADALRLLEPKSGCILYATCSIDPAENQQQAQWITQWHPLLLRKEQHREPKGLPGEPASGYSDGGYWALLTRPGTSSASANNK